MSRNMWYPYHIKKKGTHKVPLARNSPFPLGQLTPGALIETMNYNDKKIEKLFFQNALDWLGLSHNHFK